MKAVAPFRAASSKPSGKGKNASDPTTEPWSGKHGFRRSDPDRIDAAHLPGSHPNRLPRPSIDDGIRLHVFGDLPGEFESGPFFTRLARACVLTMAEFARQPVRIGSLSQVAAGDAFDYQARRAGMHFHQADVLLRSENG